MSSPLVSSILETRLVAWPDEAACAASAERVARRLGEGIGQPLTMSMVVQAVPEGTRGTALAIRLTGNRFGQVATPAAAGLVAGAAGVSAAFFLLGGLLGLAAVAVVRR
mgnify:CR=1 FL=1